MSGRFHRNRKTEEELVKLKERSILRTGVKSRSESASVAEVAASIKSSHLLPIAVAAGP